MAIFCLACLLPGVSTGCAGFAIVSNARRTLKTLPGYNRRTGMRDDKQHVRVLANRAHHRADAFVDDQKPDAAERQSGGDPSLAQKCQSVALAFVHAFG